MILLIPYLILVAVGVIIGAVSVDTLLLSVLISGWYLDWSTDTRVKL